jgi:hypothetical protein
MACDLDDREDKSPSPMEPRTGADAPQLGDRSPPLTPCLSHPVLVKRLTREMTLRDLPWMSTRAAEPDWAGTDAEERRAYPVAVLATTRTARMTVSVCLSRQVS